MSLERDFNALTQRLDREMARVRRQANLVLWVWVLGMVGVCVLLYGIFDKVGGLVR